MKLSLGVVTLVLGTASIIRIEAEPQAPLVEAWPVVRGSIGGEPVLWYVAFARGGGVSLCPLQQAERPFCQPLDGLSVPELRAMQPDTWATGSTFWLAEPIVVEGVPPEADAHVLALTAMLAGSKARLERTVVEPTVKAAVEQAGATQREWARAHRTDDALFEAFTRHESIGMCSQDPAPQLTARLFAELALARGDLPTFLDLQVQLIGNRFNRVAWSSFAHRDAPTEASRLRDLGVDVDQLLLGLLIQRPGSVAVADDWRLARAIREAGRTEALLPRVEALATSSSLDAYNRFRATQVWLHLQVYDEATRGRLAAVKARATQLALHPLARARIDEAD